MNKSDLELFGRNNYLTLINYKNKNFIKKRFASNNITKYSRFYTELFFIKKLLEHNFTNVPKIQKFDLKKKYIIFEKIEGKKITNVKKQDLILCLKFLKSLNQKKIRNSFGKFQFASDHCISYEDHVRCVEKRISFLTKIKPKKKNNSEIKKFVNENVFKNFDILKKIIKKSVNKKEYKKKLHLRKLILSPSDFGFHNIIKSKKKLYFLDFEYSGFDDPTKLLSDFLCNPDYKISDKNKEFFKKNFLKIFYYKNIEKKFNLIFNLHKIKWCTMLLNDIVSEKYQKRRQFAGIIQTNLDSKKKFSAAKKYYFNLNKI